MTRPLLPGTLVAQGQHGSPYQQLLYLGPQDEKLDTLMVFAYFDPDYVWDCLPEWGYDDGVVEALVIDWDDDLLWEYREEIMAAFRDLSPDDRNQNLPLHEGHGYADLPIWRYVSLSFYAPMVLQLHTHLFRVIRLPMTFPLTKPDLPRF